VEAGLLLDRIAEIGMYAFQVQDKAYSDWFVRPAIVLASLENKLEVLQGRPEHREHPDGQEHCLAGRSLAAWCLANYAFQRYKDSANPKAKPTVHGRHRLGEQARINLQLWEEAKKLAGDPAMHPSWMPNVRDEPDGQQHLNTFLDNVQALVAAKPQPQNLAFADGLDDWVIGSNYQAEQAVARWQDCSATVADGVATLHSAVSDPCGDAFLSQVVAAKDYRGATVSFRGEVHAQEVARMAQLWLHVLTRDHSNSVQKHDLAIAGRGNWTWHEVTAPIPSDAEFIRFGLTLTGPGHIGLRNAELTRAGSCARLLLVMPILQRFRGASPPT
jgi:hypothetical protein